MTDRYLIYTLKNKIVSVFIPQRFGSTSKKKILGVVTGVKRDVFSNRIDVTIGKNVFVFREPAAVTKNRNSVLFMYGTVSDESDAAFFEELQRVSGRGGDVNNALKNMESEETSIVRFDIIGDENGHPKKRVRRSKKRRNGTTQRSKSCTHSNKRLDKNSKPKSSK